jgi:transposase
LTVTHAAIEWPGVIFCFRAKRADRVKLIFWDGTGLCLFAKRLEGGKFHWPRIEDDEVVRPRAKHSTSVAICQRRTCA